MDNKYRVYYLVNLNQNYNRSSWFVKDWDNRGCTYKENLSTLKKLLHSLKITPNNQTNYCHNYFQMKISCKKDEEELFLSILNNLKDVNYIKLNA